MPISHEVDEKQPQLNFNGRERSREVKSEIGGQDYQDKYELFSALQRFLCKSQFAYYTRHEIAPQAKAHVLS